MIRFKDRKDAGQQLAVALASYKDKIDTIVIGLPRGGVVVAAVVAQELNVPLDIIVTRKIGAPMQPELAIGALTQEGDAIFDERLMALVGVTKKDVASIVQAEKKEAIRRLSLYRGDKAPLDLTNKTVLLIDDGIATGLTMRAAIHSAKRLHAFKIVVAVPVASRDALANIKKEVDDIVCVSTPDLFFGVGGFYDQFLQTEDAEVIKLLNVSHRG